MKRPSSMAICLTLTASLFICLFLIGCAPRPRQPETIFGSPEHHVNNGLKLMKKERVDDAQREFERALQLDPEYSPAHRGMGFVFGMKKDFGPAFESMRRAGRHAKKIEDKAMVHVGFIRLNTMKKDKGWLGEAERSFSLARSALKDLPDAYYYMGIAYKYGYQFVKSEKTFGKVLEINKAFVLETEEQLKILQKIEMAMPESELGKRVAVLDRVTRGDVAALFIRELRLDRIYDQARSKKQDISARLPPLPPDVKQHKFRSDIEKILRLDIQGLRPFPDGTFGPDAYVTRANYALMIAHIIATIERDPSLTARYVGRASPFKDVRNDGPYFNAIMVCTTEGRIMEAKNGIFNPMGKVSGADALLINRKMKEKLEIN